MRALLDLVLPVSCAGCGVPGRVACAPCAATLAGPARLVWPQPAPAGLPPPFAVAAYADVPRSVLLAYKEDSRVGLCSLLGRALARAVLATIGGGTTSPFTLVPVPSTAAARRARGDDVVLRLARWAAADLRRRGLDCATVPALRHRRSVRDSAGLGAADRAANLAGAFVVVDRGRCNIGDRGVVLVDDLVTTGATLAECAHTLRADGMRVHAAATIAATRRTRRSRAAGAPTPRPAEMP